MVCDWKMIRVGLVGMCGEGRSALVVKVVTTRGGVELRAQIPWL